MGRIQFVSSKGTSFASAVHVMTSTTAGGVAARANTRLRHNAIVSNLLVKVYANNRNGDMVLTVVKNGTNVNSTVTVPSTTTGTFHDSVNTDEFVAGDYIRLINALGGSSGSVSTTGMSFDIETAGVNVDYLILNEAFSMNTDSVTHFIHTTANAGNSPGATEAQFQLKVPLVATAKNLYLHVHANNRLLATTVRSRINGANGSMAITINGNATGVFEDLTNSDELLVGDLFNYSVTTGTGGGTISIQPIKVEFVYPDNRQLLVASSGNTNGTNLSETLNYLMINNNGPFGNTDYNTRSMPMVHQTTLTSFGVNVKVNTSNTATIRTRIDDAPGNSILNIPLGVTGWFNSENEDIIEPGSVWAYQAQKTSGSGTLGIDFLNIVAEAGGANGGGNQTIFSEEGFLVYAG